MAKGVTTNSFKLVSRFKGYIEREDVTNVDANYLIKGSQNVVSTDSRHIANRKGYTLFGSANSALSPILSWYDWFSHRGQDWHLRSSDDQGLQVYFNGDWQTLDDSVLSSFELSYSEFWDTTEQQDVLLMVCGDKNIYMWSGGAATFASATANTITKEGATSWAEEGFLTAGTKQIVIDGITYTYTGGETTTTLTGVTPNPTLGGHTVGAVILQKLRTSSGQPVASSAYTNTTIAFVDSNPDTITDSANGFVTAGFVAGDVITVTGSASNNKTFTIATVAAGTITLVASDTVVAEGAGASITITAIRSWTNDVLLGTVRNQLYVGSFNSREVYVSKVGDYDNFSAPSVPRTVGDSAILQLDGVPIAGTVQEDHMYITARYGQWYDISFQLSSDLTSEELIVNRLKTGPQQNAIASTAVFKTKNDVVFVSQDKTFDTLGRVERINTPQSRPLSYPVKLLFERLDLTDASGIYWNNFVYIAVPNESVVLIYNVIEGYWETPQVLPIVGFSIIGGDLYGHSNAVPETYKLFDGYNDNGNPIEAIAKFAYQNGSERTALKLFNEFYTEGYMTTNTELTLSLAYEYEGAAGVKSYTLTDEIVTFFTPVTDGSLGKNSLGKANLGGSFNQIDETLPPKFRVITPLAPTPRFFEFSPIYSSNDVDQRWEILCFGSNMFDSGVQPTNLKKA